MCRLSGLLGEKAGMSGRKILESDVKNVVKKLIDEAQQYVPIYTMTPATFGFGESGHPDRIMVIEGDFYGIECKKDENNSHTRPELKPTKSEAFQKIQLEKIRQAGGTTLVIHRNNLGDLRTVLEKYTGTKLKTKVIL